ncbi:general secretion pathway protein GspK, partial [bacterium]|nr:general secretion pathway protein GspK [bacterium]
AGGYFYLTNNRDIFDREHGSPKDGRWGTSSSERHPCFELPDELWGVRYRVLSTEGGRMKCEGARWRRDQMKYELCEWHQRTPRSDQNSPIGIRITVEGNTSTTLDFGGGIESARPGDDVVILGMPREGGFLSMTLKNEYDQITARTVNYGSTDPDEIGYSTEKFDPTHYTWVKSRVPTFGGTARKAQNHSFANATYVKPYVKDNRFVNIAELQKVRTAQDWQNIGLQGRGRSSTKVLKAIGKYFTVSGVRLDPEEKDAHLAGWKQAYGTARFGGRDGVTAYSASWEPNRWAGQRLRLLSGEQRGEQFVITKSTEAGINVAGYSTPGQKQLRVREGDLFSVGPGYTTPFFYTTKEGDEGVWEWANKGIEPARYGLYLFGLNDSILTTEFLEENHNAPLDADVYNYVTRQFDRLPLPRHTATDVDDPYRLVPTSSRLQYDKSDGVYCGDITPEHISASGGLKLRLTAHNLNDKHCSGIAWFDYLCLAPAYVGGKINVNTASERVLTALSGVSPDIARAIFHGTDSSGRATLKPYRNVTS